MASQEILTRVQELYVAYYGRPADKGGLQFWADRVEADGGIDAIINAFGESAEYEELSDGLDFSTLVNNVYQQAFGRDAEDAGLDFYVELLENGEKSLAEIATTIINAAGPGDKEVFEERAAAAAEYTESLDSDDDYNLEEAKAVVEAIEPEAEASDLTEALGDLQEANAGVVTAAETLNDAVEDNAALNGEYTADADGVEAARADAQNFVDTAQDNLDDLNETTVADTSGALNDATSKHLGSTQELTEANLNTAKAGVQGEIDAATAVFTKNGMESVEFDLYNDKDVDEVLDLSTLESGDITVTLASFNDGTNNKDDNGAGGSDTIVLPDFAKYTGTLTLDSMSIGSAIGADTLVATDLAGQFASINVGSSVATTSDSSANVNGYLDITLTTAAGGNLVLKNFIKGETFADQYADGDVDFTAEQLEAFIEALNGTGGDQKVDGTVDEPDTTIEVPALTVEKFVDLLENTYNSLKANASTSGLEKVGFTLADLQDEAQDAAAELSAARAVESDADLLGDVASAISAHIGAGGSDVNADNVSGNDLLDLRSAINTALDDDGKVVINDDSIVFSSENLLVALAGAGTANDNGVVTVNADKAPTSGEGTWSKGDAVEDTPGEFTFTYEPSAEEQALVTAVAEVEARNELINAETKAKDAFNVANTTGDDKPTLAAQLDAIETQLDKLAKAEEALTEAQATQEEANGLIDGLESALSELDDAEAWFTDNDLALPVTVDGDEASTSEGDIFLFAEDQGEASTISGFGAEGEDTLYFGGEFALVSLAEQGDDGLEITDRVGDNDTQEIFWAQDGDDLQLYVEANAAAGFDRGELATDQMTQITLEDFSAEDIANFDGQALIAGVAPATDDVVA